MVGDGKGEGGHERGLRVNKVEYLLSLLTVFAYLDSFVYFTSLFKMAVMVIPPTPNYPHNLSASFSLPRHTSRLQRPTYT